MFNFASAVTVGLLALCASPALAVENTVFRNIEYLAHGYDIVKGNPLAKGTDPGWRTNGVIFQVSYEGGKMYDDFRIPDHVNVLDTPSCSYSTDVKTSSSSREFQSSLAVHVGVSGGYSGFADISFSASTDFQSEFSSSRSGSETHFTAYSQCTAYTAGWDTENGPQLADSFRKAVTRLAAGTLTPMYFTRAYGTHYIRQMLMGGRSVYSVSVSSSDYASMKSQSLDVEGSVEASFLCASGAAETKVSSKYSSYAAFSSYKKKTQLYGVPAPAPQCGTDELCGDTSAWEQTIQLPDGQPVPMKMTMLTIASMLIPSNFPQLTAAAVNGARAKLESYYAVGYCNDVPGCQSTKVDDPMWYEGFGGHGRSVRPGPITTAARGEWSFRGNSDFESSPVVTSNGTVVAVGIGGHVYSLDGLSGDMNWMYSAGASIAPRVSPVIDSNEVLYISRMDGRIVAMNMSTGGVKWISTDFGTLTTSVTLGNNGYIYARTTEGYIYKVDINTGYQAGVYDITSWENTDFRVPLVMNTKGYLFVMTEKWAPSSSTFGNWSVLALDGDLNLLWSRQTKSYGSGMSCYLTPGTLTNDDDLAFMVLHQSNTAHRSYIVVLDWRTGEYTYDAGYQVSVGNKIANFRAFLIRPPISSDNKIYVHDFTSSDNAYPLKTYRLDVAAITALTTSSTLHSNLMAIMLGSDGDMLYQISDIGNLWSWNAAKNAATRNRLLKISPYDGPTSAPALAIGDNGMMYIASSGRNLYAIHDSSYKASPPSVVKPVDEADSGWVLPA